MQAIVLSVGDELVLGQTVDTNSAWLSQQLAAVGCAVQAHVTVGDDQRAIERVIFESTGKCDFLIITGGIGPTEDDMTRKALAASMNAALELHEDWLTSIQNFFTARGRIMPKSNSIQAMIPRGTELIRNDFGTAAGIRARIGECTVVSMPGVPSEMKAMFARDVLPAVRARSAGGVILSRTLHTFGLGESAVAEKLGELMKRDRNPSVGTTVSQGIVSLRINARFESRDRAADELDRTAALCRERLGQLVYGQDEQTLQQVVGAMLTEARRTVTTAESCTGGLLAKMFTDVSGSSAYFKMGFVTYSNDAKYERLGVSREIINTYGAVSEPVVSAMATNARRLAKADFALAISGVAGPTGGTEAKPVGTVCIALASGAESVQPRTFSFPGDRDWVRDRAAKTALNILRYHLLGAPMPM